jgi:outer membrane receptor for ferrienterochelin and colicins
LGVLDFQPKRDRGLKNQWGSEIATQRWDTSVKVGYVFPELSYQSFGFQAAYSSHDQKAYYGLRKYDVNHQSLYTHLLFNSILGNTLNKFKVGINYTHDLYDEAVDLYSFDRKDLNWGGYLNTLTTTTIILVGLVALELTFTII